MLQVVVVALGIVALTLLLLEPRVEGVNAHATTLREIYFDDPFLALVYIGAIPFFVALYKAFKLLGYIGRNELFSEASLKALRAIKYCAITIIGFVVLEEIFIMVNHGNDDAAGGVFMGLLVIAGFGVVAVVAKMFERILQNAMEMKAENERTV